MTMNNTICTAGDHNFPLAGVRKPLYDYLRFETSACTTYYRREGNWKRERNWFLRAQE